LTLNAMTVTPTTSPSSVTIGFQGQMQTAFLKLIGLESFDLEVSAKALRAEPAALNLALVLDITDSMNNSLNGKKKVTAMKEAAHTLLDTVMTTPTVKVGVLPFLHYINIGTAYSGKNWVKVPSPTVTSTNCSYPNATGCSYQPGTCDGVPCQVWSCTDPGPLVCTSQYRYWTGCIGVRPQAYHGSIADPVTVPYSGFVSSFDTACGPSLQPLSNDITQVRAAGTGLYTAGNTYIPGGLVWGWNMLTPDEPLTEADSTANLEGKGGNRVMVLMTDGVNSNSPQNATSIFTLPHASTTYGNSTYTNNLTSSLCTAIKQQGIIIYTVLFDEPNTAMQTLMQNCASSPDKAFVALSTTSLMDAFRAIAVRLQHVKLLE
jgi:hypothetical protein